jgi:site-specific DNA-methyltransferase (adenine-specific)
MIGVLHIVVARKPIEGTIVENCLQWGCGALNIDGCRIATADAFGGGAKMSSSGHTVNKFGAYEHDGWIAGSTLGRFPANLILGGEEVVELFPQAHSSGGGGNRKNGEGIFGMGADGGRSEQYYDSGSASRFFFNFTEQESDE